MLDELQRCLAEQHRCQRDLDPPPHNPHGPVLGLSDWVYEELLIQEELKLATRTI